MVVDPKRRINNGKNNGKDFPFYAFATLSRKHKFQLELVESLKQYRAMLKLRKKIYVEQEGFPYSCLCNGYEKHSVHILAKYKSEYVGMISVKLDDKLGLPVEKYLSMEKLREDGHKIVEYGKLGVLNKASGTLAFYDLMGAAYAFTRFCNYNMIVLTTVLTMNNGRNMEIYNRMGFNEIGRLHYYEGAEAAAMAIDLNKTQGLMWKPTQLTKLARRLILSINSESTNIAK